MCDTYNHLLAISPTQDGERKEEGKNCLWYLGNHDFKSYFKTKKHK